MFVDYFYLDKLCLIHFMDMSSRLSTAAVVNDKSTVTAIMEFEQNLNTHFWDPKIIRCDKALSEGAFKSYTKSRDIKFDLVAQGSDCRNAIESKNGTIRNIFIGLKNDRCLSKEYSAVKAVSISNALYGSSVMSVYELAKGY